MPEKSVAKQTCAIDGCEQHPHSQSRYCHKHFREIKNKQRIEERSRAKLHKPDYFASIAAYKRSLLRRKNLKRYCTEAYLLRAKREDRIYATALRKWLREWERERRQLAGIDPLEEIRAAARKHAKRRYWEDPEGHRLKSQAFKHARPDYREQWNAKRGQLERELSDGTLTVEVVQRLFVESAKCPYCGDPYQESRKSLDHIIPLSKAAGRKLHSIKNVIVCCYSCNYKKRTKGLAQFLEELKASLKPKNAAKSREALGVLRLLAANN